MSRVRRIAAAVLVVGMLSACSVLPESGPVQRTSTDDRDGPQVAGRFNAPGPGKGDAPIQIVNGFLTAMTANPSATATARSFLTKGARDTWNPTRTTVVYAATTVDPGNGSAVRLRLSDPRRLDARGGWLGAAGSSFARMELRMVEEDGEWRIADPPDALLIPDYFLTQEYQPFELYFFDQSQRVLVPDRVYLPNGEQTPSLLVRALLDGPGAQLAPITRTAFPPQTQLDLSVPVSPDGVAEVPLSKQMLRLPPSTLNRVAAQLAWTLRQVPGISRIRLSVGDSALALPDGRRDFGVQTGERYAPTVRGTDPDLYALRAGRLVRIGSGDTKAVTGPFGRPGFALRSVTVDLAGDRAAGVSATGRDVFTAPVAGAVEARRAYTGTDVLPPAYDMFGGAWLVDRAAGGARVLHVEGGTARPFDVPGVSGRRVTAFTVSRDGSRLVAVLDGRGASSSVVVANLLRSTDGDLARAEQARAISSVPSDLGTITDLAWRSPDDLALLGRPGAKVSQVGLVSLDGSPGDPEQVTPDSWPGAATGLVGTPDSNRSLYLVAGDGSLHALETNGRWRTVRDLKGLTSVGYVG